MAITNKIGGYRVHYRNNGKALCSVSARSRTTTLTRSKVTCQRCKAILKKHDPILESEFIRDL
jgi:hypothetical protein